MWTLLEHILLFAIILQVEVFLAACWAFIKAVGSLREGERSHLVLCISDREEQKEGRGH